MSATTLENQNGQDQKDTDSTLLEHEYRLEDLEDDVGELKEDVKAITPKPINVWTLALIIFTILGTLIGSAIVLENKFSSRPTFEFVDKQLDKHESGVGHPEALKRFDELSKQLGESISTLNVIKNELKNQGESLKEIKEKLK